MADANPRLPLEMEKHIWNLQTLYETTSGHILASEWREVFAHVRPLIKHIRTQAARIKELEAQNDTLVHDMAEIYGRTRPVEEFNALKTALQAVWDSWKDSENANDPESDGYAVLQKVRAALRAAGE